MTEWSEWFYRGLPVVGDYIQCQCYYEADVTDQRTFEGVVIYVVGSLVKLFPDTDNNHTYMAVRWRRRTDLIPESEEVETERELETV